MMPKKNTVAMAVLNDFTHDSRVLREAVTLVKDGYSVAVVALLSNELPTYEVVNDIKVFRIKNTKFLGFRNLVRYYTPLLWNGSSLQRKLYRKLAALEADIYHAHDLNTLLPCHQAAKKNNAKLIYDSHELFLSTILPPYPLKNVLRTCYRFFVMLYFSIIERLLIRKTSAVITVNDTIAEILSKKYKMKTPTVIMNVPDVPHLKQTKDIRRLFKLATDSKIILFHGMLGEGRGLLPLVHSMQHLPSNYFLLFIGTGGLQNTLQKESVKIFKNNNVLFHPMMTLQNLFSYMPSADIGVVLYEDISKNMKYAAPNKLFEFMSAGLPLLCSDLPVMRNIVKTCQNGLIATDMEPKKIAESITHLVSTNRFDDMQKNSLKCAKYKYNWAIESKKLLQLYKDL